MTAPIYATLSDYRNAVYDQDAIISDGLLAAASLVIDELAIGAVYDINDTTQLPTDTAVLETLRDATCAQAQWMDATGDTTGVGDVVEVESASIGSVSFTGRKHVASVGRTSSGRPVAPAAWAILRVAGFSPSGLTVYG